MDKILQRLNEDYDMVQNMGYEVVGVFLQGSQNYGLDYEGSDIDSKVIVLPKFNDFILNHKPLSTTHVLESNEHVDLKDIRLMFDCFKKQNINFLEILFTKYKVMNPVYEDMFQPLLDNNELIARYNNYASVNCMVGMMLEKHKAMEHPYPSLIDKIEKYKFDCKQLHHIIRLYEFLQRYIKGTPYKECLISEDREYLINVKRNCHNLEEARTIAKQLTEIAVETKKVYMDSVPLKVNKEVEVLLNNVLINIIKSHLKNEILKEDCNVSI